MRFLSTRTSELKLIGKAPFSPNHPILGHFNPMRQCTLSCTYGNGLKDPDDARKIAHRAVELGFTSTVGIIHDNNGQLKPLGPHEQEIFEEVMALGKRSFSRFNEFQHNVARGKEHNWRCRSGSRYLYICEV